MQWFPHLLAILKGKTGNAKLEAVEEAISGLQLLEEVFKKSSKGKHFFGGDTIGYLDIALGSILAWIKVAEEIGSIKLFDEDKTPLLVEWVEKFISNDVVKGLMPEINKLVEHCKVLQATTWNVNSTN